MADRIQALYCGLQGRKAPVVTSARRRETRGGCLILDISISITKFMPPLPIASRGYGLLIS